MSVNETDGIIKIDGWVDTGGTKIVDGDTATQWVDKIEDAGFSQEIVDAYTEFFERPQNWDSAAEAFRLLDVDKNGDGAGIINSADVDIAYPDNEDLSTAAGDKGTVEDFENSVFDGLDKIPPTLFEPSAVQNSALSTALRGHNSGDYTAGSDYTADGND